MASDNVELTVPPRYHHLVAVAVLIGLLFLLRPEATWNGGWRGDERIYAVAFEAVAAGESPYDGPGGDYIYPPSFAVLGALGFTYLGTEPTLWLVRWANLLGAVALAWTAFAWLPIDRRWRLPAAAALLLLSPGIAFGLEFGNVSLACAGATVLALGIYPKHPVVAGLLMAFGLLLKPLAPVALLLLALHRPRDGGHAHLLAAFVTGFVLLPTLVAPHLAEFLTLGHGRPEVGHNVSLHRLLWSSGVPISALVVAAVSAVLCVLWVRRHPRKHAELVAIACGGTLLAVPLVWTHSLLLTLPLQAMALYAARQRFLEASDLERRQRWLEAALVGALVASLHFCAAVEEVPRSLPVARTGAAAVPALAPVVLALFVVRHQREEAEEERA